MTDKNYAPSRTWAAAGYSVAGAPAETGLYGMDGWPFEFPAPQIGATEDQPKPRVEWKLVRSGRAWEGTITIPTTVDSDQPGQPAGKVTVKAKGKGKTKEAAVRAASSAALKALNNPLVRSVLPPGASQVVAVLGNKKVQQAIAKYGAKGAKAAKRAVMRLFK